MLKQQTSQYETNKQSHNKVAAAKKAMNGATSKRTSTHTHTLTQDRNARRVWSKETSLPNAQIMRHEPHH
eukprot:m.324978 g.324978  ORF g.324978 m.324978 type:complete len:70 (+) comp16014_c0_seq10:30-239(+)